LDKIKQNIIKNIAQELDCGFDCFYNSKTTEIIALPNFSNIADEDDFKEAFQAELEQIEKHQTDFIKFEVLESFESFKIMELFVEQLSDKNFQSELKNVLTNRKPFQNFKSKVEYSDFKQNWFDFKQQELEKRVESELNKRKASAQQKL
jgi:hypothetical protein